MMSSIFSRAVSICSGAPLSLSWVPLDRIFNRGNFFLRMSSLPLFTPKNSIGFTVSRLIIVSVNALRFMFHKAGEGRYRILLRLLTVFRSLPLHFNITDQYRFILKLLIHRCEYKWFMKKFLLMIFYYRIERLTFINCHAALHQLFYAGYAELLLYERDCKTN